MAELLPPPEVPVNGGTTTLTEHHPTTQQQQQQQQQLGLTSKRQRRPSVRLGEIGDQSATLSCESYRRNKLWSDTRYRLYPSQKELITSKSSSTSKTRALTNFGNGHETLETQDEKNVDGDVNLDLLGGLGGLGGLGNQKGRDFKGKRGGTKRVRSNWASSSKVDEGGGFDKFSGDEWCRDFDADRSESPLKEHSPVNSIENAAPNLDLHDKDAVFTGQRRPIRTRRSESRDHGAVELEGPSDNDGREWRCRTSVEGNGVSDRGRCSSLEDGVRMWLSGLGLGRYEPIFEIHEVDEEVLPLLTLEDLKDMGINAVGSRRKLYSAIQKLGRGFS